jgi:hypothetical protein
VNQLTPPINNFGRKVQKAIPAKNTVSCATNRGSGFFLLFFPGEGAPFQLHSNSIPVSFIHLFNQIYPGMIRESKNTQNQGIVFVV